MYFFTAVIWITELCVNLQHILSGPFYGREVSHRRGIRIRFHIKTVALGELPACTDKIIFPRRHTSRVSKTSGDLAEH